MNALGGAFKLVVAEFGSLGAVMHDKVFAGAVASRAPQGDSGIGSIAAHDVVDHIEIAQPAQFSFVVFGDPAQRLHAGFFGRGALAHLVDDGVGSGDLDVLFAVSGCASGADLLIGEASSADDGRVADAARNFPRQA